MNNIKIKFIDSQSWVPEIRIKSNELMRALNTGKPDDWVEKKLGIAERALAIKLPGLSPIKEIAPSCAEIAEKICAQLLKKTNTDPNEINHLILVTCTPDELNFKFTVTELHRRLDLPRTARIHEIPSGCAGLVEAFDTAAAYLKGILPVGSKVLTVAVNLTSPFFIDWQKYVQQKEWLSAVIFADGACAQLWQSEIKKEDEPEDGLILTFFEVDSDHPLMRYPAGGVLNPTMLSNVHRHLFSMNAKEVEQHYRAAMVKNFERLKELRPELSPKEFKRIYLHQANPKAVEAFRIISGLGETQVPLEGNYLGNPSAAVTGIMFDHDWQRGTIKKGDLLLFSVVGAGGINGSAVLKI